MTPIRGRVLVVDDDEAVRVLLAGCMANQGHTVRVAASGTEALHLLASEPFGLVLLDLRMPGMSGIDVLKTIRSTPAWARLPVVTLTGDRDDEELVVAAQQFGADDWIAKPIDAAALAARVRAQLARGHAEDRLRDSEERYALTAAAANDGLWDWKLDTNEMNFSARWKAIVGCAENEVGSHPEEWFERIHSEDRPRVRREVEAHMAGLTPVFESEHRVRHKSGSFRWVLARGLCSRSHAGVAIRMAGSQADVTDGKVFDALTGLPNRMLLIDRLERLLQQARQRSDSQFAVLFLDLDGFKVVNDSLGHMSGDELIQAVSRRLEASLRPTDLLSRSPRLADTVDAHQHTLARIGGDEFIVLLHDVRDVVDATRVAERLQQALAQSFSIGGREVSTTVSIGIAVSATGYTRPEELLRDADTAMYRAKALGKARTEVFDSAMREAVVERLRTETAVRLSIQRNEFLPYYQPVIELRTGRLVGFEALLRWQRPDHGIVAPAQFVPLIEENGLLLPIGRRFLQDVCAQLRAWHLMGGGATGLWVNVNFGGGQILEPGLPARILECLDGADVGPEHLVVEISESTAMGHFKRTADILRQLRGMGLRVVLDDFGTGYSSLACLDELPISGLKLDPSFTRREAGRPRVLRAVAALARSLDLTVTAEGVETPDQCRRMQELGCDYAQGYFFARPIDAAAASLTIGRSQTWLPEESGVRP